jgi:hypothetical protein
MTHCAWRHLVILLAAAISLGLPAAQAMAADDSAPRIVDCRVGFADTYKVGYWTPIGVAVAGDVAGKEIRIDVTTVDCDGVKATIYAALPTDGEPAKGIWTARLYAKMGRLAAPIEVTLRAGDRLLDRREIRPGQSNENGRRSVTAIRANSELILHFGPGSIGLGDALPDREATEGAPQRRVVQVKDVDALPTDWFGYEAVDVLVLSTGDGALVRRLAADVQRFAAIERWVNLGGKLVISCGGRAARQLLTEGAPLAPGTSGRFVDVVRMPDPVALEHYAQTDAPVIAAGARSELQISAVAEVAGEVELYGAGGNQWPLVIRAPRGLGEVTFVGLDFDVPPLAGWAGRPAFLRAMLRPFTADGATGSSSRNLVTSGYDDLSGALRQRLGQAFSSVRPVSFQAVMGLAILFLLVIGPIDYIVVRRWLRRPALAWATLPLNLLVFGAVALAIADSRHASRRPAVNQVELVDVDVETHLARGSVWSTLYSPQARQYDVAIGTRFGKTKESIERHLAWHGLVGSGIGGMSSPGTELEIFPAEYRWTSSASLAGVPLLTAATKSFHARWTAPAAELVSAQLADRGGMLVGSLTNQSGMTLQNARLLYRTWAYRLKDIPQGASVDVDEESAPTSVQTLLTGAALGEASGAVTLAEEQAAASELIGAMMFHEAAGGAGFTGLPLHYHTDIDLSRLLTLGRAILVAESPTGASRLIDPTSGEAFGDPNSETTFTVYRFVLPVQKNNP